MNVYERGPRRNVLDKQIQTRALTLFSHHAREFLKRPSIVQDHIVGFLIDKSWAHGIPTPESDIDVWILSRGELSKKKQKQLHYRLNRFFDRLVTEISLPGTNAIDADLDSIDIVDDGGRAALVEIFEYNRGTSLILISPEKHLAKELAEKGIATLEY